MSDYTPVLVAILFVALAFAFSTQRGIVGLLSSGVAAAVGMAVLLATFTGLPGLAKAALDVALPWRFSIGVAAVAALVVFAVVRIVSSIAFKRLFNRDGCLHAMVDGPAAGLLSLLPGLVGVFIYFTCIRAAGTVQELNYVDSLSRDQVREMAGKIPPYPRWARWRNAVESLPLVAPVLDATDPFSRRSARNAAAFVLAWDGITLRTHLLYRPETRPIAESPIWGELAVDSRLAPALRDLDRVALVTNPPLQAAAADPELRDRLDALDLRGFLEDFVRSLGSAPPTAGDAATPP